MASGKGYKATSSLASAKMQENLLYQGRSGRATSHKARKARQAYCETVLNPIKLDAAPAYLLELLP